MKVTTIRPKYITEFDEAFKVAMAMMEANSVLICRVEAGSFGHVIRIFDSVTGDFGRWTGEAENFV